MCAINLGDLSEKPQVTLGQRLALAPHAAIRDWPATEPRMRRATRRLVRRHRRTIALVANALIARGALTARQIDALVRRDGV
jgi:hypothetical protein